MATDARVLDVTRTQLIQAPPARVMAAFFNDADLKQWWMVARSLTVPRPLGMYAVEWDATDFKDEVLGRLGGAFHGTIIDYRPNAAFFLAEAFWQPPDGDPIGPMSLEVSCRMDGPAARLDVRQSGFEDSVRWRRYYEVITPGWKQSLHFLRIYLEQGPSAVRFAMDHIAADGREWS